MTEQRDLFGLDLTSNEQAEESVTLTLISQGDAGNCLRFSQTEDGKTFLLPSSQISVFPTEGSTRTTSKVGHPKYPYVQVRMPVWLARDRGLI